MLKRFYIDNEELPSDFHCRWHNFPKIQYCNGITIFYKIGESGVLFKDKRCILQIMRRNKVCTVTICNDGGIFSSITADYHIATSFLDHFGEYFNRATPRKIREYYPLLNMLIDDKTVMKELQFHCFNMDSSFMIWENEPILGDKFTDTQVKLIVKAIDCILDIEDEFLLFKQSKFYVALNKYFREKRLANKKHTNNIALYASVAKMALLALRVYNAGGSGGADYNGDFDVSIDSGNISFDNFDLSMNDAITQLDTNPDVLDYLVSPDNSSLDYGYNVGYNGGDISFTGGDNSQQIASLQTDLNKAKHDIDYYSKEINQFDDNTSSTYRSNCLSSLNSATQKAKDLASKIEKLQT